METSGLGVKQGIFDELKEEVGQTLSQALKRFLRTSSVKHVGLSVDQVYNLSGQVAVPFFNGPFSIQ